MTRRPRRRRPAAASRVLTGGASVGATLALVAAMGGPAAPADPAPADLAPAAAPAAPAAPAPTAPAPAAPAGLPAGLRVVITDPRIDPATAVAAATKAALAGQTRATVPVVGQTLITVPVAAAPRPAPRPVQAGTPNVVHTRTRSS